MAYQSDLNFNQPSGNKFYLLFSLIVLFLTLIPVSQHEYLFHDDYMHLAGDRFSCARYPMASWFSVMGRPLANIIVCLQFGGIEQIGDAWIPRLVTVCLIGMLLVGIYRFLHREGIRGEVASLIAFGICVMPGFLIFAYWLGASFILFAIMASCLAAYLCQSALKEQNRKLYWKTIFIAMVVELIADLIYQTGAMFIWVLAAIALAKAFSLGMRRMLRVLAAYGFVGIAANTGYLIWFTKISEHGNELAKADPSRGTLFSDFGGTLHWFFDLALPRAARMWFIESSHLIIPIIVGILFCMALAYFVISKKEIRHRWLAASTYVLSVMGLGVACFIPMLVAHLRLEFYRSLVELSAFIFAITVTHLWLSLEKNIIVKNYVSKVALIAISALGILMHGILIGDLIRPAVAEYQTYRNSLILAKTTGHTNWPVHVIVPEVAIQPDTDELGIISSNFFQDIPPIVNGIRQDLGEELVPVSHSISGESFGEKDITLVNLVPLANSGITPYLRPANIESN